MSDLSKFLPKNYLKTPLEDQMIKPIDSLNMPKHDLPQNSAVDSLADNLANNDLAMDAPLSNKNLETVNNSGKKAPKKIKTKSTSSKKKNTLLLLILLFLLVSSGAGLILMKQRQDTRQEAYLIPLTPTPTPGAIVPPGGGFTCGPNDYGRYCRNDPSKHFTGNCVVYWCYNGNPSGQGCDYEDVKDFLKEGQEFGTCDALLKKARTKPKTPGCWQVDAVDQEGRYCYVSGGCESYELDVSDCSPKPLPTTPTPTLPPTTVPPTTVPPTRIPPTITPTTVPPTKVPPTITPTTVPPTDVPTPTITDTPSPTPTGTLTPTGTPAPTADPTIGPTSDPTINPTSVPSTPTPVITQVITTVGCNESCNENADCTNISHICYESFCRLDVNPTDVNCRLADGGNVIERAVTVPTESGFANWFNFIKVGFGILGLGALLLLLL